MAGYRAITMQGGVLKQIGDTQGLIVVTSIERDAAAAPSSISLFTNTAVNQITIGRSGQTVLIGGDLNVTGAITGMAGSSFEADVIFGKVPPGPKGTVAFNSTIGDTLGTYPNLIFTPGSHLISVDSPIAAGAGGALTIQSGPANGAFPAGVLTLDTGAGVTGTIEIGQVNATLVEIGQTGQTVDIYGATTLGANPTDYVTVTGQVVSPLVFKAGSPVSVYVATPGAGNGDNLSINSAAGAAAGDNAGVMSVDCGVPGAGGTGVASFGATNATTVNIGLNAAVNVGKSGSSTTINGKTVLGTLATDTITQVGEWTPDFTFVKNAGATRSVTAHVAANNEVGTSIRLLAPDGGGTFGAVPAGAGGQVIGQAGAGGPVGAVGSGAAGLGGDVVLTAGAGGHGNASKPGGNAGQITLTSGKGGGDGGGGGGAGGDFGAFAGEGVEASSGGTWFGYAGPGDTSSATATGQGGAWRGKSGNAPTSGSGSAGNVYLDVGLPNGGTKGSINIGSGNAATVKLTGLSIELWNAAKALAISSPGITVQAGYTLGCTGTGTINLPNNTAPSTVFFQIGGVAVTAAAITAANFDILFNNSDATGLHYHSSGGATQTVNAQWKTADTLIKGSPCAVVDNAGVTSLYLGDQANANKIWMVGLSDGPYAIGATATIVTQGNVNVLDANWGPTGGSVYPVAADVGKPVFLDVTAGLLLTWTQYQASPPNTGYRVKVGICTAFRSVANASYVYVQPGEPVFIA